jgi:CcmD family protein
VTELGWLFVALAVLWIGIGGYLLTIGARQRKLERRVDELTPR